MITNSLLSKSSASSLIPPILDSMNIKANECHLYQETQGGKKIMTFSVTWRVPNKQEEVDEEFRARSPYSKLSEPITRNIVKEPVSIVKSVKCDGPCGKEYPSDELLHLGLCAHNLCPKCSKKIVHKDGSVGCSAFACCYTPLYASLGDVNGREKMNADKSGKTEEPVDPRAVARLFSQLSIDDKASPYEVTDIFHVRLMVFEPSTKTAAQRILLKTDVPASTSLKLTLSQMLADRQNHFMTDDKCPVALYLSIGKDGGALRIIDADEFDKAFLWQYAALHNTLYFVLDCANFVKIK